MWFSASTLATLLSTFLHCYRGNQACSGQWKKKSGPSIIYKSVIFSLVLETRGSTRGRPAKRVESHRWRQRPFEQVMNGVCVSAIGPEETHSTSAYTALGSQQTEAVPRGSRPCMENPSCWRTSAWQTLELPVVAHEPSDGSHVLTMTRWAPHDLPASTSTGTGHCLAAIAITV